MNMEMIDDAYWLKYAKNTVDSVAATGSDAIERLEKLLLWLWAIYTTTFVLSGTFEHYDASTWALIVMALPVVLLIITYTSCAWARQPLLGSFDTGSPDEIREYFNGSVRERFRRLTIVGLMIILSTASVAAALFAYRFAKTKKAESGPEISYDSASRRVFVNGRFAENKVVVIKLYLQKDSTTGYALAQADTVSTHEQVLTYGTRVPLAKRLEVQVTTSGKESDDLHITHVQRFKLAE